METKYGVIGFLLILAAMGGTYYLTPDQLDKAYYCISTEKFGIFYGGTSNTGITAYPFKENRTQPAYCLTSQGTKVPWVRLTDYAKEIGVDPLEFIQKPEIQIIGTWGKQYLCDQYNCTEIK